MSQARQLYELQEVEQEIELKGNALREVEAKLGRRDTLDHIQGLISQEQATLDTIERRLHDHEWEAEDLGAKVTTLEGRLYSGRIGNPKELSSLQHEVELLKSRHSQVEDRSLELMVSVDKANASLAARRGELEQAERQWQEEQAQLQVYRAELSQALAALRQRQHGLAQQIEPDSLSRYRTLQANKGGRAVARVEQGMCQGCRISLPTHLLQQARQQVVQCTSCHRILHLG